MSRLVAACASPAAGQLRFGQFLAAMESSSFGADDPGLAPRSPVDRLRNRDPGAWRDFFSAEMPAIYQYVSTRVPAGPEAEDLTSEVFEAAWASASRLQDRGLPPRAWLFGIARNVLKEHRRRWWRRPPAFALTPDHHAVQAPVGDDLALADAIARLPAGHAEVINLRFVQGLSLQETADALGVTTDSVKGRQSRALLALRKSLT